MLVLDGLSLRLGGNLILDHATAALPPRSHVGLVGRNGAGKSTLLKLIAELHEPDDGRIEAPSGTRIGYLAQEAPGGEATPFETVLAAATERAELLAEAEHADDGHRIAEIHERLNAIDAHGAPARASRILAGLGFPEETQHRPLSSFSGGWRMRVALAALLFSEPDLLLLDEPSNHLDLEAALWLEAFLKSYRRSLIVVSHERDLLNNVVDHVLHVERGAVTLYPGNYDAFARLKSERRAQADAFRARQAAISAGGRDKIDQGGFQGINRLGDLLDARVAQGVKALGQQEADQHGDDGEDEDEFEQGVTLRFFAM